MSSKNSQLVLIVANGVGKQTQALERISEESVQNEVDAVEQSCKKLGYQTEVLYITNYVEGLELIQKKRPGLVFNLCEGLDGKSKYEMNFAALLEWSHIPFTGSNALTLGLARNKNLTQKILRSSGIQTTKSILIREQLNSVPEGFKFPLICKPACEDASLGIFQNAVIRNIETLKQNVNNLLLHYSEDGILLEEYIEGREFNVALYPFEKGIEVLQPSEIDFSGLPTTADRITGYEAKWLTDHSLYRLTPSRCPALITENLKERLQQIALQVHYALLANSYGRVDLRVDFHDQIYVLEYNPNPDISLDAGLANSLKAGKISYQTFIQNVILESFYRMEHTRP